uniref:PX domain-containing protein n=1 Tax=Phaeomonas parva TaxID=124430 RepID=A0A7S1TTB4_9STRA|mmetsp:Transcript_16957/g.52053  ORF Transcript_16957/g.52053 Transcript_16957/m.52053 type:complete len:510 (+) Transcript_16957:103-1632(+)
MSCKALYCFAGVRKKQWRKKRREVPADYFDLGVDEFAPAAARKPGPVLVRPGPPKAAAPGGDDDLLPENVRVGGSETRQTDEVDKKPFTMYRIYVGATGIVERRYSQFFELRSELLAKDGALLQRAEAEEEAPFPPKVFMGNLAWNVVETRLAQLNGWLKMILRKGFHAPPHVFSESLLSFLEKGSAPKLGVPAPRIVMQDLAGCHLDTEIYGKRYITMYAFGSRYNFQQLTNFLTPAMADVRAQFPDLPLVIVSVADLRICPEEYKHMVEPFLLKMNERDAGKTLQMRHRAYPNKHMAFPFTFFIPDYNGETLRKLGASDVNWTFRVVLAAGGKIVGSIQSTTKNKKRTFISALETACNDVGNGVLRRPMVHWDVGNRDVTDVMPPPNSRTISHGALALEARGDEVELKVDLAAEAQPQMLGVALRPSRHIPLRLGMVATRDDGTEWKVFQNVIVDTEDAAPVLRFMTPMRESGSYVLKIETEEARSFGMTGAAIDLHYSVYSSVIHP